MTTYSIKAPDGNTYDIDGPEGASDEQVRSRVLAAHPEAAKPRGPVADDAFAAKIRASAADQGFLTNLAAGAGKAISDVGLGARQLAASVGVGDKAALAAEAAERERLDKSLMDTGGGMVGKYGTDVATSLLPFGAATKAVGFLPKAQGALGLARGMLPAALGGAAQEVVTPDKDYNPLVQAGKGAAFGVAGEGVGRLAGRALSPIQEAASDTVRQHLDNLTRMPGFLAENLTDNKAVKALTNALSYLGPAGAGVNKVREAQLGQMTENIAGSAGLPTKQLTPEKVKEMVDQLTKTVEGFKAGPDVSLKDLPKALMPALRDVQQVAAIGGGSTDPLRQAIGESYGKTISAAEALAIRSRASQAANSTGDWVKQQQFLALRDKMDDAIKATHADKGTAFEKWKAEYGTKQDIAKAGTTPEGFVKPADYLKQLEKDAQFNPDTPLALEAKAAEHRFGNPTTVDQRGPATNLLKGVPLAAMAGGTFLGGPLGLGLAAGGLGLGHALLGTQAGGRYLTGQAESKVGKALQSERMRELLRQLGYAEATN